MKKSTNMKIAVGYAGASVLLALTACSCASPNGGNINETVPYNPTAAQTGTACVGTYYGCFRMTNNLGTTWITPPTNVIAGTFNTPTNIGNGIQWSLLVSEKTLGTLTWCTNNNSTISFPASFVTPLGKNLMTNTFSFYMYVNTQTNDSLSISNPIELQLVWTTTNSASATTGSTSSN